MVMNFQTIVPVERSKDYLELAFSKARVKSQKKLEGEWLEKIRKKEMIKLEVVKEQLAARLDKIVKSFPSLGQLGKFYVELIKLTLDYGELKKALGGVSWAIGKVRYLHKKYVSKIGKCGGREGIKKLGNEFYGRVSSVVKQIDEQLVFLEESRKVMRRYPDVKEMFTVCIFGFPNVGKTTLLNKLTGAQGKVAEYAFTTVGINCGYFGESGGKIQVLDVPGSLARVEKMNDIEKIAYLVVRELAEVVVYVFDLSENCGYSVKEQEKLFRSLKEMLVKREGKKEGKVLVYLSKRDIIDKETVEGFVQKYKVKVFEVEGLKGEIGKEVKI